MPAGPTLRQVVVARVQTRHSRTSTRCIRLAMLKGFELTCNEVSVPLTTGPRRVLAYLGLHETPVRRTLLAGSLWADTSDRRAAGNLRSALWRIGRLGLDLVEVAHDQLHLSQAVEVDIRKADRLARRVMDPAADVAALELDELPFQGDLLPGWSDDWIILERERRRQVSLHALEALSARWAASGLYTKAVMAGLAAVASEPLRDSAQRALINAYIKEGNSGEALRQYGSYRNLLRHELRLEPSQQLTQMIALLDGTPN